MVLTLTAALYWYLCYCYQSLYWIPARLLKDTEQWFRPTNSARMFINLSCYYIIHTSTETKIKYALQYISRKNYCRHVCGPIRVTNYFWTFQVHILAKVEIFFPCFSFAYYKIRRYRKSPLFRHFLAVF